MSRTKLIKENRELRKYLDVLESELIQGTINERGISLFHEKTIYDYSCKCGGTYAYRSFLADQPLKCDICKKTKKYSQLKIIEEQKILKEDTLNSLQETIDNQNKRKLEEVEFFRQTLAKIYRVLVDDSKDIFENSEESLQQAKEIQDRIYDYSGIVQDLQKTRILTLIAVDGKYIQEDEKTYKLETKTRTKGIDEINFSEATKNANILSLVQGQFTIQNLKRIINIPEQKIRKNFLKSDSLVREEAIETEIHINPETEKLRQEIDERNRLAVIHKQNQEQKEEHEKNLKSDPYYNLHHCKSHRPAYKDSETKNPDEFDSMRFYKSNEDRFSIPLIKVKHYDYERNFGTRTRAELLADLIKFNAELDPMYEIKQITKRKDREEAKKQNEAHEKWVSEMLAKYEKKEEITA